MVEAQLADFAKHGPAVRMAAGVPTRGQGIHNNKKAECSPPAQPYSAF